MPEQIHILVIEDSQDDFLLIRRALEKYGFDAVMERVDTETLLRERLPAEEWDLVISDYSLPGFSGTEAVRIIRENAPDLPCIMVSGKAGEETAVEAMRTGASDYILKSNLARLAPAVRRELDEHELRMEKRKVERQLIESNENIEAFLSVAQDDYVLIISPDGIILAASGAVAEAFGVTKEHLPGISLFSENNILSEYKKEYMINEILRSKASTSMVVEQHGRFLDCSLYPVMNSSGEVVRIIAMARDITRRKRVEDALRESELRLRMALDAVEEGLWDWDIPTGKCYYSPRFYMMLGFEPNEFPASFEGWINVVDPEDVESFSDYIDSYLKEGKGHYSTEFRVRTKNGDVRWFQSRGRIVAWDSKGIPVRMVGTHTDITERKEIEGAILRERQKLLTILGSMNDGVFITNAEHTIEFINSALVSEFGEPDGKRCYELFGGSCMPCPWCGSDDVLAGKTIRWEWHREDKDRYYDMFATPIYNSDGSVSKLEIFHDITDLKRAEGTIRAALAEKDTLLKEIHHRVKNNLQIISSLLSLQERFVRDPADVDIFRNSRFRVKSMALIHETLYQSENIAQIDVAEYAGKLISHLVQGHMAFNPRVRIRTEINDIRLGIDFAIPCGLIINELLTNSFKYAFPDGRAGEVVVEMTQSGGMYHLSVCDDGVGMPESVDFTSDATLGMHLIFSLIRQLHAEVRVVRSPGCGFFIDFKQKD
jgi:PAS domain S-box-containing protein